MDQKHNCQTWRDEGLGCRACNPISRDIGPFTTIEEALQDRIQALLSTLAALRQERDEAREDHFRVNQERLKLDASLATLRAELEAMERVAKACGEMADKRTADYLTLRAAVQGIDGYVRHKAECALAQPLPWSVPVMVGGVCAGLTTLSAEDRKRMDAQRRCTCGLADALACLQGTT